MRRLIFMWIRISMMRFEWVSWLLWIWNNDAMYSCSSGPKIFSRIHQNIYYSQETVAEIA